MLGMREDEFEETVVDTSDDVSIYSGLLDLR